MIYMLINIKKTTVETYNASTEISITTKEVRFLGLLIYRTINEYRRELPKQQ